MSLEKYVKSVSCLSPRASVLDASRDMKEKGIGAVVIISDDYQPIGLLTDRDLVVRVLAEGRSPEKTAVEQGMTANVAALAEGATLEQVTELMRDRGVRRVVVLDENQRVTGLVSLDDVLLLLGMELGNVAGTIFANLSAVPEEPRPSPAP